MGLGETLVWAKQFSDREFIQRYRLEAPGKRVLNAGSSSLRYGSNFLNVDIQDKEGVDVVCDIHDLPPGLGEFDAVICNAALQYCHNPHRVAAEFMRVLKPGGLLFVDAPWVQPFCEDTADRHRYSETALRDIFREFEIVESGPSILPGSALSMLCIHIAGSMTSNKYVNHALRLTARLLTWPLRAIRTAQPHKTAGAFYLIARKGTVFAPAVSPQPSAPSAKRLPVPRYSHHG